MAGEQGIEIQVDPDHYGSQSYLDEERERSYEVQHRLLADRGPVLEVGIGPGVLAERLASEGTRVVTADLDPRLEPDLACSVTDLPFQDGAFASVAAFEVLEHLPLDRLDAAVGELCRVADERVVVSVPEKEDKLATYLSLFVLGREWEEDEHHWELGLFVSKLGFLRLFARHGYGLAAYDARLPWHRFFVFRRDGVSPWRGRWAMRRDRWSLDGSSGEG